MLDPVRNFAEVVVSTGYDDAATSIVLSSGEGAKLPAPASEGAFNLVWWNWTDYPNPKDDPNKEIVRCTARSTDTLTVTRNQESSGASTKNEAGKTYHMALTPTKKFRDDLNTAIMIDELTADTPLDADEWGFYDAVDAVLKKITWANIKATLKTYFMPIIYPVGSIYINATDNTNPATLFGFGTWTAFGAGRVPVGFSSGETEFDTAEETGGAKTHTLTDAQLPATEIEVYDGSNWYPIYGTGGASGAGYFGRPVTEFPNTSNAGNTKIRVKGSGSAHNNLQPYITVYMWKRTA